MKDLIHITIVGRANVGKSTLFNRIIRKKKAMVSDVPRVTRDRNISRVEHYSKPFELVDTGGFETIKNDKISDKIETQIKYALETANIILFIVDGKMGITPIDHELINKFRKLHIDFNKKLSLVVNKVDDPKKHKLREYEFYELGSKKVYPVSAESGYGVNELIEELLEEIDIQEKEDEENEEEKSTKLLVLGKPNVGKSSFVNKILGEERVIVDALSGTTRDPIDVDLKWNDRSFTFIDTAGMRKKAKLKDKVERLSVSLAEKNIYKADVVLMMLDATEVPSDQDIRMLKLIEGKYKPLIILVNKSDLLREKKITKKQVREQIKDRFHFMNYAPINFISIKTGEGIESLYKKILVIEKEYNKKIPTSKINKFYNKTIAEHQMPMRQNKRPKIYYLTQERAAPPTFLFFCNYPKLIDKSYKKYITNKFREEFNFQGVPLKLVFKSKK